MLLVGTLPFGVGDFSFIEKLTRFLFALGVLLALQFAGFVQACHLRNAGKKFPQRLWRWLPIETAIITILFIGAPEILLLDEATNGLDPESSFRLKEYLREFCQNGGTVLFSSHIIETVEHLCDRLVILQRGRVQREMQRDEWQSLRQRGTSLEREFIAMVRT